LVVIVPEEVAASVPLPLVLKPLPTAPPLAVNVIDVLPGLYTVTTSVLTLTWWVPVWATLLLAARPPSDVVDAVQLGVVVPLCDPVTPHPPVL